MAFRIASSVESANDNLRNSCPFPGSCNFTTTFERLLERAGEVDPDGVIRDAQMSGGHGLLYRVIKRHQLLAPPELADPNKTGTHIEF